MDLLEKQREWHKQQDKDDRLWREKQELQAQENHKEALEQARQHHWRELIIGAVVVTIIMVATTLVAAFIERGSLFSGRTPPSSVSPSTVP